MFRSGVRPSVRPSVPSFSNDGTRPTQRESLAQHATSLAYISVRVLGGRSYLFHNQQYTLRRFRIDVHSGILAYRERVNRS